jgi:O-antigen/teichoic acid export membrane protein
MSFGYASLLISLARNILFVPIYLHSIPMQEFGAWLATGGALALILINDFGLSGVVIQKISVSYGAGDFRAIGSLAGSALVIGSLMALALTCISLAFLPVLPGLQSVTELQRSHVVNCFLIAAAANGLGLAGATIMSILRSLQRVAPSGSVVLVADLINVAVTLVGLYRGLGLYSIALGMLSRSGVLVLGGAGALAVIWPRAVPVPLVVERRAVTDLLGDSSQFFLTSIAMKLQSQANVIFVSAILGPSSAGFYALTVRAHETVMMLIGQINSALVPSVTHLFGSRNMARYRAVLLRLLLSVAIVTALALSITVILNQGFLRLWIVNQTFVGQGVSMLMAAALFLSSLGYVAYDALVSQGEFKFVSRVLLLSSLLQVLLLAAFLRLGMWIAPAAMLVVSLAWGSVFWRRVSRVIELTSEEARGLWAELARIVGFSVLTILGFSVLYPLANSWSGLVAEGLLCMMILVCGYSLFSSTFLTILREEIAMTLKAFRLKREY